MSQSKVVSSRCHVHSVPMFSCPSVPFFKSCWLCFSDLWFTAACSLLFAVVRAFICFVCLTAAHCFCILWFCRARLCCLLKWSFYELCLCSWSSFLDRVNLSRLSSRWYPLKMKPTILFELYCTSVASGLCLGRLINMSSLCPKFVSFHLIYISRKCKMNIYQSL